MKNKMIRVLMLLIVLALATSCELIGGIFKAGMGVGILIVIAIVGIVVLVLSSLKGNK